MTSARSQNASSSVPRYSLPEAARYLRVPVATLRSWVAGRRYPVTTGQRRSPALIQRPQPRDSRLSFANLVEAYVLAALRREFKVKMKDVRNALDFARKELGVERVLLSPNLTATVGSVFLEHLGHLIDLGRHGQAGLREVLDPYLQRIEWNPQGLPARIFPLTRIAPKDAPQLVAIDPEIAFGRPILRSRGVRTAMIAERFAVGESLAEIAEDYDLKLNEVEEALRYESVPSAA